MSAVDEQFSHVPSERLWIGVRDFSAGVFGGMCGVVAGQPLDFVRIRLQTASKDRYSSAMSLLKDAIQREGPRTIWKGMLSPIAGVSFQNAITFLSYGQAMHFLSKSDEKHSLLEVWTAGTFAGLCQSIVVCPVEHIKIKLQIQTETKITAKYKGPWDCAQQLVKENGIRALYKGMISTLIRDASSYGLYFWAYEAVKRAAPEEPTAFGVSQSSPLVMFFAGGVGGVLSWALCYPIDIVKTNIQADSVSAPKFPSILSSFKEIYRRGGWRAFTVGLSTTCVRGFIVNGALFAGYEFSLALMK